MSAPAIGLRSRWAPASARVDWSHPLSQGLAFCVVPSVSVHDLAIGYQAVRNGTPTPSRNAFGAAARLSSATSDFLEYSGVPDAPFLGPISFLWVGNVQTASAFRSIAHKHAGAGGSQSPFSVLTDNAASPQALILSRANLGNRNFTTTTGCLPVGVDNVVVITAPEAIQTSPAFYVNGLEFSSTSAGSGSGASTGSSASIRVGRRADGAVQSNGDVSIVAIWSRALSVNEVAALTADPFQMLRS